MLDLRAWAKAQRAQHAAKVAADEVCAGCGHLLRPVPPEGGPAKCIDCRLAEHDLDSELDSRGL